LTENVATTVQTKVNLDAPIVAESTQLKAEPAAPVALASFKLATELESLNISAGHAEEIVRN
jgi:hypothetical protein